MADLIEFLAYSGLRIRSEALWVTWEDIDWKRKEIIVRDDPVTATKNSETRRVPLIQDMQDLLKRLKEAAFPVLKTIETFDFTAQVSINEPLGRELLRGEYLSKRENLLLVGNPGTGKTHLATALGFAACT